MPGGRIILGRPVSSVARDPRRDAAKWAFIAENSPDMEISISAIAEHFCWAAATALW
jgi:hypothetical protein